MKDVNLPITTARDGNKITKVCVEDVYKMINRIQNSMNKSFCDTVDVMDSLHKEVMSPNGDIIEGELIIGTGNSQPCLTDAFDEEIGNNIAFMKAKLNANIKKHRFLTKAFNAWEKVLDTIDDELTKVEGMILMDLNGIRNYNPEYLSHLEGDLGIIEYDEIEDEEENSEEE